MGVAGGSAQAQRQKRAPCCKEGQGSAPSERRGLSRGLRPGQDRAALPVRCRPGACSADVEPGAQRPGAGSLRLARPQRLQPSGPSEPHLLPSKAFLVSLLLPGTALPWTLLSVPFAARLPPRCLLSLWSSPRAHVLEVAAVGSCPSPCALGSLASLLFLYQHKYPSASPERTRNWLLYPPILHLGFSQR